MDILHKNIKQQVKVLMRYYILSNGQLLIPDGANDRKSCLIGVHNAPTSGFGPTVHLPGGASCSLHV